MSKIRIKKKKVAKIAVKRNKKSRLSGYLEHLEQVTGIEPA